MSKQQTPPQNDPYDLEQLAKNWGDMLSVYGDFIATMAEKQEKGQVPKLNFDPFNLSGIYVDAWQRMLSSPEKLGEQQMALMQTYQNLWENTLTRLGGGEAQDIMPADKTDRRFRSEAWTNDAVFSFIRQSYLATAEWVMHVTADNAEGMDKVSAQKLAFFTKQFMDALSPSNFALTNPDVIKATLETGGANLIRGMKNLVEDMRKGGSSPYIRMTDETAFKVGENIANTKGEVIFRNEMMELIHYYPAGAKTLARPLLIVPPWINKYYILDLKAENSLVRWALEQGHAVFMVSWVNPDASLKDASFEDYMKSGVLAALEAVEAQTGQSEINTIGYCIGGTLLAMTLAWLKARGENTGRVASATFFTTLLDFENAGDLKLFVDEAQLESLSQHMQKTGFMDGEAMKTTFNMLRANDLIWTFVVNNYLLGREPFPFDLLYWNADSTNLPACMHEFYLRHMYLQNDLIKPGALEIDGTPIDIGLIDTPAFFLSTRDDHIAPWKATFSGAQHFKGDVRFVLAASGHIAGVVNPPAAQKYCYWTSDKKLTSPDNWLSGASEHAGSWWPYWHSWIEAQSAEKVVSVQPNKGALKALCPAPGEYVLKK